MDDATLDGLYGTMGGRQEWRRYVTVLAQNASTYITRPANEMYFTQTGGAGPGDNTVFIQDIQVLVATQELSIIWELVPLDGMFGGGGVETPANVDAGLGCINATQFMGYPPGTLRLNSSQAERIKSPINVGGDPGIYVPPLLARVRMSMTYFNPKYGGTGSIGTGPTEYLPWNLLPYPGPVPAGSGRWFKITSAAGGTGDQLYQTYEFADLFDLNT